MYGGSAVSSGSLRVQRELLFDTGVGTRADPVGSIVDPPR